MADNVEQQVIESKYGIKLMNKDNAPLGYAETFSDPITAFGTLQQIMVSFNDAPIDIRPVNGVIFEIGKEGERDWNYTPHW